MNFSILVRNRTPQHYRPETLQASEWHMKKVRIYTRKASPYALVTIFIFIKTRVKDLKRVIFFLNSNVNKARIHLHEWLSSLSQLVS